MVKPMTAPYRRCQKRVGPCLFGEWSPANKQTSQLVLYLLYWMAEMYPDAGDIPPDHITSSKVQRPTVYR